MTDFQIQPEALRIAKIAAQAADEKQATDIPVLNVVVHVFDDDTRRFYEIERLYSDVPLVSWRLVS